jgi:hypothetical protein
MVNVLSCICWATVAETPKADCIHETDVLGNELPIKFSDMFAYGIGTPLLFTGMNVISFWVYHTVVCWLVDMLI